MVVSGFSCEVEFALTVLSPASFPLLDHPFSYKSTGTEHSSTMRSGEAHHQSEAAQDADQAR
jgi:hypothetical protein